jgi:soluble lytic murein transglycosylase-like protein
VQPQGPSRGLAAQAEQAHKACQPYREHLQAAEKAKKLPAHTLEALIWSESRCNPKAENKRTRARGLGQFVPSGAAAVGRIQRAKGEPAPWFSYSQAFQAVPSIRAAAELLAYALDVCGSLVAAVGMYGSGKCSGAPSFARRVLRLADALRALSGEEPRT